MPLMGLLFITRFFNLCIDCDIFDNVPLSDDESADVPFYASVKDQPSVYRMQQEWNKS